MGHVKWCLSRKRAVCLLGSHHLPAKQTSKSQAFVAHSWDSPPGASQVVGSICPPAPSALCFCCSLGPWSPQHVAAIHTKSGLFIILESHLSLYGPTLKKAEHQRTDAFKLWCWMTLESPLDCKEIQPVHPKGNQPWIFIGRTDAEAEAPILWPPDVESQHIGEDPDAGKDWGQEEKGTTEDEMVGWHHQLNGHEFEQTLGDNKG